MSTKHALLIGINHYPYMEPQYQLNGCVNDAKLLKGILKNKFNFDPINIISLYDEAATRDAILAEMQRLVEVIEENDIVVFHFSGHGHSCRVKTEFSDEGSGKINSIVPHDDNEPAPVDPVLAPKGKIWREIREGQINQWLQQLAKKTPYTTLIFDACHSGTMTRSSQTTKVRGIPQEQRGQVITEISTRSSDDPFAAANNASKPKKKGWLTLSDNYVVISGCRDTQKSKEVEFSEPGWFYKHGVLSYFLCGALSKAKAGTTYRDVFETVTTGVVSKVNAQNPQIEGAVDREVFGVKDIEPLAFIAISEIHDDHIILDGGAAHGLRNSSIWEIYPPFSKQANPEESLGRLKISQVGAVASTAELIHSTHNIPINARCVEVDTGYVADKLKIYLQQTPDVIHSGIASRIGESQQLQLVDHPETADVVGQIVEDLSDLAEGLIHQQQNIPLPLWAFFEVHDELCMPLHAVNKAGVVKILIDNLEKIARFRNVLQLNNSNTSLNVEFNLYERKDDESLILANGGNSEFIDGKTPMVLEIKNNEVERTVFFSLLWINATREISSVYPYRKVSEELSPGKTVRIGDGSNKLTASLSDRYFADVGSEACKVMFSTVQSDFRWLNQDGMRSTQTATSNIRAFDDALSGEQENTLQSSSQVTHDWDAITRSFVLIRKSDS